MSAKSSEYLKSLFLNGKIPCEEDFAALIDAIFDGTIWYANLVFNITGDILVDPNDPKNNLIFQIDGSDGSDFSNFIFQSDSSIESSSSSASGDSHYWEFWDGTSFQILPPSGLNPSFQNEQFGLVVYNHESVGKRGDEIYLRYRSGFDTEFGMVWSDYIVRKVILG